jgi:hypothetical protein
VATAIAAELTTALRRARCGWPYPSPIVDARTPPRRGDDGLVAAAEIRSGFWFGASSASSRRPPFAAPQGPRWRASPWRATASRRGRIWEAGAAAVSAGAVEHGVGLLRQACAEASACGDGIVHARSLLALGSALVHAVRGRDEEGAPFLHEAVAGAEAAGDRETLVGALRELAYTDIQAGRRSSVEQRLARADRLASGDAGHAAILAVQGMNRSDMGDYLGALEALAGSIEHAERCGDRRQAAFSLSLLGRAHCCAAKAPRRSLRWIA